MWRVGPGGKLLLVVLGLAILAFTLDRYALNGALLKRAGMAREAPVVLGVGDFPPGAAAPATDIARVPTRALKLAVMPRGSAASLLLATGGTGAHKDAPVTKAYGLDVDLMLQPDERAVSDALALGGDRPGGADAAVLSVDRVAQLRASLSDLKLKTVLLISRSRGHEAIAAAAGISQVASLRGRKVAVPARSPARFFLLWELAQVPLWPSTLEIVRVESSADAARLLREARVDAAAGAVSDLIGPARERAGGIVASSADAPQLIATVLVVRAEFLARFPDAVRRLARAQLDSADAVSREPGEAARLLSASAPQLGDPFEAIKSDPPAVLLDNLAFFDVKGDAPVRYEELYKSAAELWRKLGEPADTSLPADTRELGPLMAAAAAPPATSSLPALKTGLPAPRPPDAPAPAP
ncbi:MAG TPA: ABC transporter substrate-binding protein [Myxococcales bacterium]|jgi:ABC-type nitrate/sulfonate/bicarbonate transport system substrate-binding protein